MSHCLEIGIHFDQSIWTLEVSSQQVSPHVRHFCFDQRNLLESQSALFLRMFVERPLRWTLHSLAMVHVVIVFEDICWVVTFFEESTGVAFLANEREGSHVFSLFSGREAILVLSLVPALAVFYLNDDFSSCVTEHASMNGCLANGRVI